MNYEKIAQRLVNYKNQNNSFYSIDEKKLNNITMHYLICSQYFPSVKTKIEKIEKLEKIIKMRHSKFKFIRNLSKI